MILPSHLVIMVISYPIFFLTNGGFKSVQIKQEVNVIDNKGNDEGEQDQVNTLYITTD